MSHYSKRNLYKPAPQEKVGSSTKRKPLAQGRLVSSPVISLSAGGIGESIRISDSDDPHNVTVPAGVKTQDFRRLHPKKLQWIADDDLSTDQGDRHYSPRRGVPKPDTSVNRSPLQTFTSESLDLSDEGDSIRKSQNMQQALSCLEPPDIQIVDASNPNRSLDDSEVKIKVNSMRFKHSPAKVVCHTPAVVYSDLRNTTGDVDKAKIVNVDHVKRVHLSDPPIDVHPHEKSPPTDRLSPRGLSERGLPGARVVRDYPGLSDETPGCYLSEIPMHQTGVHQKHYDSTKPKDMYYEGLRLHGNRLENEYRDRRQTSSNKAETSPYHQNRGESNYEDRNRVTDYKLAESYREHDHRMQAEFGDRVRVIGLPLAETSPQRDNRMEPGNEDRHITTGYKFNEGMRLHENRIDPNVTDKKKGADKSLPQTSKSLPDVDHEEEKHKSRKHSSKTKQHKKDVVNQKENKEEKTTDKALKKKKSSRIVASRYMQSQMAGTKKHDNTTKGPMKATDRTVMGKNAEKYTKDRPSKDHIGDKHPNSAKKTSSASKKSTSKNSASKRPRSAKKADFSSFLSATPETSIQGTKSSTPSSDSSFLPNQSDVDVSAISNNFSMSHALDEREHMRSRSHDRHTKDDYSYCLSGPANLSHRANLSQRATCSQTEVPQKADVSLHKKTVEAGQAQIDLMYSRYLQYLFLESKAKKAYIEQEKDLMKQMYGLWEQNDKLRERMAEAEANYAKIIHVNALEGALELQTAGLAPVVATLPKLKDQYSTLAKAVDTTRHQIRTKGVHIPDDEEGLLKHLQGALEESEQLLADISVMTRKQQDKVHKIDHTLGNLRKTTEEERKEIKRCDELLEAAKAMTTQESSLRINDIQMRSSAY